jgi:hypothetical protein
MNAISKKQHHIDIQIAEVNLSVKKATAPSKLEMI